MTAKSQPTGVEKRESSNSFERGPCPGCAVLRWPAGGPTPRRAAPSFAAPLPPSLLFFDFKMHTTALVLFSGGQDSATCLADALSKYQRVETLGFDYGQRHRVELDVRGRVLA